MVPMRERAAHELRKFMAPEFVYGVGALGEAGRYAKHYGARKVLVVTDPGVVEAGWADGVFRSLNAAGVAWEVFQDVTPNPKEHEVAAGARLYSAAGCDVIVAVGGGSPMDCAKGIGAVSANGGDVLGFEGVDEVPTPGPPLICVPTTAGSSADVSQFAIITDTERRLKIAIVSKTMVPDAALVDPETTTTMPADLTAATGLDAFAHAVEAYVSNASSPITDLHALEAVSLVSGHLADTVADPMNLALRDKMMLGSLYAGLAFSNASLGLAHAMAHALGGLRGMPHGLCNAVLLEHVVGFNYSAAAERYDRIAAVMGVDLAGLNAQARKNELLSAIRTLREDAGVGCVLGDQGIAKGDIPRLAANAVRDLCLATNPRSATTKEIERLYEAAL